MSNKMTLSVTIITKNEEDRIRCCLESVKALADEIIVLDKGTVIEKGTHEALLEHNGYYAELYSKQLEESSSSVL